ncbi:MAG: beta-ketoacyl synthase N-terminal-like domain-containing protein [Bacteroidetes bacterium]|nr:beta-ketoacyl synthase N-terminal-like domain-containing protein [Bacteroidota bacterium]
MNVFVASDNIISPLGFTSSENFEQLIKMHTGVTRIEKSELSEEAVCAAIIDTKKLNAEFQKQNHTNKASEIEYTRLEKMAIISINDCLKQNPKINIASKKTLLVLSTTKGNIDLLDASLASRFDKKRVYLWETAKIIAGYFKNPNQPIVVSNACISGVLAIIIGKRLLEDNTYDTVIVSGVDIMTHFVVSGFQSFKAISNEVAKPYDSKRDGISLGEGCGTIVLTNNPELTLNIEQQIFVKGGASSNDANHISGPSRTGDGLLLAIEKTLKEANVKAEEVNYISGHGTATLYNDDMESIAISDAQLAAVPMNSLKSYFGHTLGAAGLIESIVGIHSMRKNTLIGTYNFNELGVAKPINIIKDTTSAVVNNCLKTSAGFGGCNAAVFFQKVQNN